jgi:D-serine deaminase-like pyridoxal phosphate-dependent protein
MERNLAKMAAYFADTDVVLRPHVKLHKATPVLAHKQLAAGGVGVTCAKLGEAERMAAAGIRDILIANQIVGTRKITRLVNLAAHADVMVAVDTAENVEMLSNAAAAKGVKLGVLVEVNIGHNRAGVPPLEGALSLAHCVHEAAGLRLRGIMGYDGHCTVKVALEERGEKSLAANRLLVETRRCLEAAGLPVEIVSAGGTFTYQYAATLPGITEIQAGTYLLMDTTFRDKGVDFECALSVLGTVTSRPTYPGAETLAIIDVGRKAIDTGWGLPQVRAPHGATVVSMSQEHGRVHLEGESRALRVGDTIELWASDANTTINLYDCFYAMRGDTVEAVWEIPGHGVST